MARIEPFCGYRFFDPETQDSDRCAAPPYDVLDDEERALFAARSSANIVHLTLPIERGGMDRYASAAKLLSEMVADGRLRRDPEPSFYTQDVTFTGPEGRPLLRKGLVARVEIEAIGEGSIRGHEEVQAKPIEDRYRLLAATHANLEPVYFIYSDPNGDVDRLLEATRAQPALTTADVEGARFELRRADPAVTAAVRSKLKDAVLYIADGHHRFTVAHRFANERGHEIPGARFRLAVLVRAEDEGVVILPTHRFVHELSPAAGTAIRSRLDFGFELEPVPPQGLIEAIRGRKVPAAFGVWDRARKTSFLASPTDEVWRALSLIAEPLRRLDVTVLHRYLLDPQRLGHRVETKYVRGELDPIGRADIEDVPLAFFLSAPTIQSVLEVSDERLFMPTKSTYFSPKAASGQVLLRFADADGGS